jgi:Phage portal protein, SPP1 Gp6-like
MPIDFWSPSYRAASSDLTVAISPLGLVELADEEFEVHGPRLNRYSAAWAWYLGHHWSYRREMGDNNITMNYVRTMSDFITNFCFGKGIQFKVPEQNQAIIPRLLHEIWDNQNNKHYLLWQMGQLASVTGDCFVKVAYDEPYEDGAGVVRPGRVRILPLNPAHCFPEYHPHDRERLLRFKLKYRFWGTSPEGTRQVYTFTEILTDELVQQYVNDELIDSYPNPIGTVPIVHIPNITITSSPWGQSDIWDVIQLNRELNEKMTEVSDIINYHAAPVTIITGAKASQLERGPKKVWAGLPKDAQVFNLESRGEMAGALEYIQLIKRAMHEITGVPETALGQFQPVSNTSGVALAIQYQPLMNRYQMKKVHFTNGLEKLNEIIIRTAAVFLPELLVYDPTQSAMPEADQLTQLDPMDPNTYKTTIHWPEPLPVDALIKLNEAQAKMALGIESKKGALRSLGEEFPNEKMIEIFDELMDDAIDQGALDMVRAQIGQAVMLATGLLPDTSGMQTTSAGGANVSSAGSSGTGGPLPGVGGIPPIEEDLINKMTSRAYGARFAQRRIPDEDK